MTCLVLIALAGLALALKSARVVNSFVIMRCLFRYQNDAFESRIMFERAICVTRLPLGVIEARLRIMLLQFGERIESISTAC